jgi:hypothetical protein
MAPRVMKLDQRGERSNRNAAQGAQCSTGKYYLRM